MYYSPLRYPGGKGKILSFMKELVEQNNLKGSEYLEPYAGGSAVALGLLFEGYVRKIHINDIDPAVNSFWDSILNHTDDFIYKIKQTDVTIKEWRKQKKIYLSKSEADVVDLGFSAFYLNRCNYSGVLKGGPIGGIEQNSDWKIDARFNKKALIQRIEKIAEHRSDIHIYKEDTYDLLVNNKDLFRNSIVYLDPPYFVKGHQLYENHYKSQDHENIAKLVQELESHWVVSYDNVPEIVNLYLFVNEHKREFNISYSAGKTRNGKEVMFFSEGLLIPDRKIC